jgi:oxygen-dependent protoporphyrinogen oxidase
MSQITSTPPSLRSKGMTPRISGAEAVHARPVAVLGGGITGLTAAWHLRQAGIPVVVFEAGAQSGGTIGSTRINGWLHENGPNSLFESSPEISAFIDAIGLGHRRLYAPETAKKRFVVRGGRALPLPASPFEFVTSGFLSWRCKLGLLGEPFRPRASGGQDETVAAFVARRLGPVFLDYIVNPFVAGVYAGDPRKLSVRHAFPKLHALEQEHGSLIRRRNPSGAPRGGMLSFPDGLQEIPRALAASLGSALRLETKVDAVQRTTTGWDVYSHSRSKWHRESFSSLISALPADALARLAFEGGDDPHPFACLEKIAHPPVISVFTGFLREDVAHPLDGFGLLAPEVEKRSILGTLFSSTLFPGRAPQDCVGLTTFIGGARQPELAELDDTDLIALVSGELKALLGTRAPAVFTHLRRCARAIPQYNVGFQAFKDIFAGREMELPNFYVGGNCRDGISLSNCIASGRRLADCVVRRSMKA